MTTYEAVHADLSASSGYTAEPSRDCLNGCQEGTGPERGMVVCEPGYLLCPRCIKRLDRWLRALPESFALLLWVKGHGTVPGNPENARTKQPDAPAPMRLEVVDLLDVRPGFGALAILHGWAEAIRDERKLPRRCTCDHARPSHGTGRGHDKGHCTAAGCGCGHFTETSPTFTAECKLLLAHLNWCAEQDWAGDLYTEIRNLDRQLSDTVGDYRAKPVGKCEAWVDRPGVPLQTLCGGALVMDREKQGVVCLGCGKRYDADDGLRELGLIVGAMFGDNRQQEAS